MILDHVARSRETGSLQSELSKQHNIPARNFHYVAKHLVSRNLVTRMPVKARSGSAASLTNHVVTQIVHLPVFCPRVSLTSNQARPARSSETQHFFGHCDP